MRVPSPSILWLGWIIWLPFFSKPVSDLFHTQSSAALLVLCLALLAMFIVAYSLSGWQNAKQLARVPTLDFRDTPRTRVPNLVVLVAMGTAVAFAWHAAGVVNISSFVFTSAYVGGSFRPRRAILTNVALAIPYALVARLTGDAWTDVGFLLFLMSVVTFVTVSWVSAITAGHALHAAQGEIARLAAESERNRITRDLHDLLGHQLSLITLKSALAARLIGQDPTRAADEMQQVEALVRSTLHDVRAAVSRSRKPTLDAELRSGKELLEAAGIEASGSWSAIGLGVIPTEVDETLAWCTRESVTNVIRHSHARSCRISAKRSELDIEIWIENDDRTGNSGADPVRAQPTAPAAGSGLNGIRDRVAALGGSVVAGSDRPDRFSVRVIIPLHNAGATQP